MGKVFIDLCCQTCVNILVSWGTGATSTLDRKVETNMENRKSSTQKNFKNLRKAAIGIASSAAIMAVGISNAMAFDEVIEAKIFTIECTILLFTNPALHLTECGVGNNAPSGTLAPLIFQQYVPPPTECDTGYTLVDGVCVPEAK